MAYEVRSNPGNRLGIWADKIEQKRVAMRLDRSGFPLPREDHDGETDEDDEKVSR